MGIIELVEVIGLKRLALPTQSRVLPIVWSRQAGVTTHGGGPVKTEKFIS